MLIDLSRDWVMYVLECADKSFYAGITTNLDRRLHEHNHTSKAAKYTRSRRPVRIVYYEPHTSRSGASKSEAKFKKLTRKEKETKLCLS